MLHEFIPAPEGLGIAMLSAVLARPDSIGAHCRVDQLAPARAATASIDEFSPALP